MFDEKIVDNSIKACKELKTYYGTRVFSHPENIFDLDTFLEFAEEEAEEEKVPGMDVEFERKLEEALDYGEKLRSEEGRPSVVELARKQMGLPTELTDEKWMESAPSKKVNAKRELAQPEKPFFEDSETQVHTTTKLEGFEVSQEEMSSRQEENVSEQVSQKKKEKKKKRKKTKSDTEINWDFSIDSENASYDYSDGQIEFEQEHKKKKNIVLRVLYFMGEIVFCVVIAFVLSYIFTQYVGMYTVVSGTSMESALEDGDGLFVNKLLYYLDNPQRFDVVIFPYDEDEYYIKRIIGMPGETVSITNGVIYIDGKELEESYGKEKMLAPDDNYQVTKLDVNEYFVLGDNRNHSKDSRSADVGLIKRSAIKGKAIFRLYPFDRLDKIK